MRPRIYITNDSFPELREVPMGWRRSATWLRAIFNGMLGRALWWFLLAQVALFAFGLGCLLPALGSHGNPVGIVFAIPLLMMMAYFQVSWGGDIMRSHLRAVNDMARNACPSCGHDLRGHFDQTDEAIKCSECAAIVTRDVFEPPFPIPRDFRAFPPW